MERRTGIDGETNGQTDRPNTDGEKTMDGQTDGWMDGWRWWMTDRRADRQTDRQKDRHTEDGWMEGRTDGRVDGSDAWLDWRTDGRVDGWNKEQSDGCLDGYGWMVMETTALFVRITVPTSSRTNWFQNLTTDNPRLPKGDTSTR